jgi:hypothetical protein
MFHCLCNHSVHERTHFSTSNIVQRVQLMPLHDGRQEIFAVPQIEVKVFTFWDREDQGWYNNISINFHKC